eukprot:scaffold17789_cov112-Isochrysis_galbana.AAC.2
MNLCGVARAVVGRLIHAVGVAAWGRRASQRAAGSGGRDVQAVKGSVNGRGAIGREEATVCEYGVKSRHAAGGGGLNGVALC